MKVSKFALIIVFILIAITTFGQNKKVLVRKHLGYIENYGTGKSEIGGKHLEFDKKMLDSASLVFTVVSGKSNGINVVAKNKYDVWVSVINKGQQNTIFSFEKYFRRYNQDSSYNSYMITVNGSHNYYEDQACKVEVELIKLVAADSTFYETNYETDGNKTYKTVAADGVSYLTLYLNYPGNKSISISYPEIGQIKGKNFFTATGQRQNSVNVPLDESGYAQIRYYPPKYITQEEWKKKSIARYESTGTNSLEFRETLPIKLNVSYLDHRDEWVTDTVRLSVCRTPIFFIHGFLGSASTWSEMSGKFRNHGFLTYTHDYHAGAGSIGDQSRLLKDYISEYFNTIDIKVKKVDLVCHSMGGLIARNYVQSRIYDKNIRKLITVGTPHHGVGDDNLFYNWVGYWLGEKGAQWYDKHKVAIQELKTNSAFLKRLNSGETNGTHLVKGIQYGNIYTTAWDYVVWSSSAWLNMVPTFTVFDVAHSKDLTSGFALTNHPDVEKQILKWLETDLKPVHNQLVYAELSKASSGEIFRGYYDAKENYIEEQITTFPSQFNTSDALVTKEGKAIIHLKSGNGIWGSIFLDQHSEIYISSCSPHLMEVRMFRGKAIFKSRKEDGNHFFVSLHDRNSKFRKDGLFVFSPLAFIRGLNTEFAIENLDEIKVYGLEGELEVLTDYVPNSKTQLVKEKNAVIIKEDEIANTEFKNPEWGIDLDEIIDADIHPDNKTVVEEKENDDNEFVIGLIVIGLGLFLFAIFVIIVIFVIRKLKKS